MAITLTIGGKNAQQPSEAMAAAQHNGTPTEFWGKANSFTCPRGKAPGRAFLLLKRGDLDDLDRDSPQELFWREDGTNTLEVARLWYYRGYSISMGSTTDADRFYFTEWRDVRQVLHMSFINKSYNVRKRGAEEGYTADSYFDDTLNAGAVWSWQEMLDDIWDQLPSAAGSPPTLPYAPAAVPERWHFDGMSAWDAYCDVLTWLSVAIVYDPILDAFLLVSIGASQAAVETLNLSLLSEGRLLYDYDPINSVAANMAASVASLFPWDSDEGCGYQIDSVSVDTSLTGAVSGTKIPWVGGFDAHYGNNQTLTNASDEADRAAQVAAKYAASYEGWQRMRRLYSGIVTGILPGARVSETTWRDFGDGLVTEVKRFFDPVEFHCRCCRETPSDAAGSIVFGVLASALVCSDTCADVECQIGNCAENPSVACNSFGLQGETGDTVALAKLSQCGSGFEDQECEQPCTDCESEWVVLQVRHKPVCVPVKAEIREGENGGRCLVWAKAEFPLMFSKRALVGELIGQICCEDQDATCDCVDLIFEDLSPQCCNGGPGCGCESLPQSVTATVTNLCGVTSFALHRISDDCEEQTCNPRYEGEGLIECRLDEYTECGQMKPFRILWCVGEPCSITIECQEDGVWGGTSTTSFQLESCEPLYGITGGGFELGGGCADCSQGQSITIEIS